MEVIGQSNVPAALLWRKKPGTNSIREGHRASECPQGHTDVLDVLEKR